MNGRTFINKTWDFSLKAEATSAPLCAVAYKGASAVQGNRKFPQVCMLKESKATFSGRLLL
jgi:hypothetical protein